MKNAASILFRDFWKKKMALLHDSGIPKSSDLKKNGTACESGQPSSAIEFCLEIKAVELRR